jgi:hypothetical protein
MPDIQKITVEITLDQITALKAAVDAGEYATYVVFAVRLRSGLITIGDAGLSPAYTT